MEGGVSSRDRVAVDAVRQDVEPCVHTAAGREGLESQVRCLACGHGIGREEDRGDHGGRLVVPRPRHTGAGEQRYSGLLGLCQKAVEEPWVSGGGAPPPCPPGPEGGPRPALPPPPPRSESAPGQLP